MKEMKRTIIGFKSLKEQIKEVNDSLKDSSFLILISLVLIVLNNSSTTETRSYYGGIVLGSSYLIAVYLLILLLYQLLKRLFSETEESSIITQFKTFNYILFTLWVFVAIFTMALFLEYLSRFPKEVGITLGYTVAFWILPFLVLLTVGLPILIGRIIYVKAKKEDALKDKIMIYSLSVLLMGIAVPTIAYLLNRKVEYVLSTPILTITIVGWALFLVGLKDIHNLKKKP